MTETIRYAAFDIENDEHIAALVEVWNHACGEEFAISAKVARHNVHPVRGILRAGRIAWQGPVAVGFVAVSASSGSEESSLGQQGWLDAIAVFPAMQRQGIGHSLLHWADDWLAKQGCPTVALGGSVRPFLPGLPSSMCSESFFVQHGYQNKNTPVWDVAANLVDYVPPDSARQISGGVRPLQPGETTALDTFLRHEFPGRWHYEYQGFLRQGGRLSDYMVLWTEVGIGGFCQLTFADSTRPVEGVYPYQLPRPWGHVGPIGVGAEIRGQGYGSALLDAGLRRLHSNGVNGCVINWTIQLEFFAKFGFSPHREYQILRRTYI